jgi:fructan beta-fructosidase
LKPGDNPLAAIQGDLFHIVAEIDPGTAREVGFELRGQRVWFANAEKKFHPLGQAVDFYPQHKTFPLELLLDRTSLEVFVDEGRVSASSCFIERPNRKDLQVFAVGGTAHIVSLQIHTLKSTWPDVTHLISAN